jgi:hypothetical protein
VLARPDVIGNALLPCDLPPQPFPPTGRGRLAMRPGRKRKPLAASNAHFGRYLEVGSVPNSALLVFGWDRGFL